LAEHYFSKKPLGKIREERWKDHLLGQDIILNSASGMFSVTEVDFGTRVLISKAIIPDNASVLDLGCGYGAVGIAVKKAKPGCTVVMTDVNERALKYARKNCKQNMVECEVVNSDLFEKLPDRKFDTILTNPPFSAGKKLCIEIIKQSKDHLNPGGSLQLVAPHNKGGSSLKKVMEEIYGNVSELVKWSGYRVYFSKID